MGCPSLVQPGVTRGSGMQTLGHALCGPCTVGLGPQDLLQHSSSTWPALEAHGQSSSLPWFRQHWQHVVPCQGSNSDIQGLKNNNPGPKTEFLHSWLAVCHHVGDTAGEVIRGQIL